MPIDTAVGAPPPATPEYDSGTAAFHAFSYANRTGWAPLALPGVIYVLGYVAFSLLMLWAVWPFMEVALALEPGAEPDPATVFSFLGRMMLVMVIGFLGYLVIWAMVEAAILRWLFGRGMKLRFGGVELMLIVLFIFWLVLPLLIFLLPSLLGMMAAGMESPALAVLCGLAVVAAFPVWIMLAVRFAPAGARTVHDGRMHLFSAWAVSRGQFWPVFGAFLIAVLVYLGASIALWIVQQILFMAVGLSALATMVPMMEANEPPDPQLFIDMFTSPGMIAALTIYSILSTLVAFLFQVMFAGINVYGVKRLESMRPAQPYLP